MKTSENKPVRYSCPMHHDVVSDEPGNCPKCGMKLVPAKGNRMAGHSILMILLCLVPVALVLLLPIVGIQINTSWILVAVLAGCCIPPMLFMRRSHRRAGTD